MKTSERLVRAIKELLGKDQWPKKQPLRVRNQDEFFLSHLVKPGDLVFDIGANHGELAWLIANLCGEKGKVVAFEPVWPVYERTCEWLQMLSISRAPIITVPLGISDQAEIVEIHLPGGGVQTPWPRLRRLNRFAKPTTRP